MNDTEIPVLRAERHAGTSSTERPTDERTPRQLESIQRMLLGSMKMRTLLPAAIVAALAPAAHAFDLKGIVLGEKTTVAAVLAAFGPGLDCIPYVPNGKFCRDPDARENVNSRMPHGTKAVGIFLQASRAVCFTAEFSPDVFDVFDQQLRAKFGAPGTVNRSVAKNAFGATFDVTTETWMDKAGNIVSLSNHSDAVTGSLTMTTPDYARMVMERAAKRDKL